MEEGGRVFAVMSDSKVVITQKDQKEEPLDENVEVDAHCDYSVNNV